MATMDAETFAQLIVRLGLVTQAQLAEVYEEIGRAAELSALIAALERKAYLTPWQRGKVLKGDLDGYILGGYRLLYKIQSGSFGRVYRADDARSGRVVAVKVLRKRWSEDQQRIDLFIREGKVGLMLKHPNIVEVLAINRDADSGSYYLVMEFVEGGNLREILQIRKTLSVAESLRVIEDCASGLCYAYSRGMTHRDIKLTNILIADTREAKLVDFGLAQFFSTLAHNDDEKVDRTVDYAGLERATGVKTGDVRSDIYFLGAVLYECLTGRSPLVMPRDKHARMRKGRFEEVVPIRASEIDGPPSVLMLVETMMALDPKQRYQTPAQLLEAVKSVRREVEGKSGGRDSRSAQRSVFVAEPDERLQDVLRDALKEQGYRVFLAGDPVRAWDRFRQHPYDGLLVDARTTGEEGIRVFQAVVDEAERRRIHCAALLLLGEEHADWTERIRTSPHVGLLSEHITFKSVSRKLKELMEAAHGPMVLPPPDTEEEEKEEKPARRVRQTVPQQPAGSPPSDEDLPASLTEPDEDFSSPAEEDGLMSHAPEPPQPAAPSSPPPSKRQRKTKPPSESGIRGHNIPMPDPHSWHDEMGPLTGKEKAKQKEKGNKIGKLWAQLSLKVKLAIAGVFVGLLLVVGALSLTSSERQSEDKVEQIQPGWSEEDVEGVMGEPGQEISKINTAGPTASKMTKKRWNLPNGKTLEITFSNGEVAQKIVK